MSNRITITHIPDATVIRIRASSRRRLRDTIASFVGTFVGTAVLGVVGRGGLLILSPWVLVFALTVAIAYASLAYIRAGETVTVRSSSIEISSRSLGSVQFARDENSMPRYSPVELPWWRRQRWQDEAGSGQMLIGSHDEGLRFGQDIEPHDAETIIEVFKSGQVDGVSTASRWNPGLIAFIVADAAVLFAALAALTGPWPVLGLIALILSLGFALVFAWDAWGRRRPWHITVS